MTTNITHTAGDRTPYTYLIGWSHLNKWYYGVRYAKGCHPSDLWTKYFTSSKQVYNYRNQHGEPNIIKVRRVFDNVDVARKWENRILRKIYLREEWLNISISANGVIDYKSPKFLNAMREGLIKFWESKSSDYRFKHGQKTGGKGLGRKQTKEWVEKRKLFGERNGMYGKSYTVETRAMRSKTLKKRAAEAGSNWVGTKNLVSSTETALRNGTHVSQIEIICEYCGK